MTPLGYLTKALKQKKKHSAKILNGSLYKPNFKSSNDEHIVLNLAEKIPKFKSTKNKANKPVSNFLATDPTHLFISDGHFTLFIKHSLFMHLQSEKVNLNKLFHDQLTNGIPYNS